MYKRFFFVSYYVLWVAAELLYSIAGVTNGPQLSNYTDSFGLWPLFYVDGWTVVLPLI